MTTYKFGMQQLNFYVELGPQRSKLGYRIEKVPIDDRSGHFVHNLYAQLVLQRNSHEYIAKKAIYK